MGHNPANARHVGNGVIPCQIIAAFKLLVHHPIKPVHLIGIAVNGIGHGFRCILAKVVSLPCHRPKAAHLPEKPLIHFNAGSLIGGVKLPRLAPEILQDGARFKHADRLSVRPIRVNNRWHLVVWGDFQKLRLKLVARANVNHVQIIGEPKLL